jgi:hypothetical protein
LARPTPRPRTFLVPVILLTLREWNSYGYELMERMAAFGLEAINPGTLYQTLRQREKDGVVKRTGESSEGGRCDGYTPSLNTLQRASHPQIAGSNPAGHALKRVATRVQHLIRTQ